MEKSDLSVVILTKNEAETLINCVTSCKLLDPVEIIVIDDNSTDNTLKIAKSQNVTSYNHIKKDFADARNFAISKVKTKWIFYVDSDEQVSKELADEIIKTIVDTRYSAFRITRQNYYLGKRWPKTEKIVRLFQKEKLINWFGKVHETAKINGDIGDLSSLLLHYTHKNLSEMVENTIIWSEIEAKLRFDAQHPLVVWWRLPRVMLPVFWNYYITQGGWQVGTVGLIESIYQSFSIFITYARLWELQNKR